MFIDYEEKYKLYRKCCTPDDMIIINEDKSESPVPRILKWRVYKFKFEEGQVYECLYCKKQYKYERRRSKGIYPETYYGFTELNNGEYNE
jgi:hypothetical protein